MPETRDIIMDDVDAVRSVLLRDNEDKEHLRNEVKSLKREVKNLNKKLDYYQMKDRLKASDKLDQAKAKRRERQFNA